MRKLIIHIIFLFCLINCQVKNEKYLDFFSDCSSGIKLSEIVKTKDLKFICNGSYFSDTHLVASNFKVESKYDLLVMKFDNVSDLYDVNYNVDNDINSIGFFSIINEDFFELYYNHSIENLVQINKINFATSNTLVSDINNDSIKSFHSEFSKFRMKFNNDEKKVIFANNEKSGLKNTHANFLFFKKKHNLYLFILTSNFKMKNNQLYNFLFIRND